MGYQVISDFFDLRPALDNQTILPFIKTNGDASNIKTRAG